MERQEKKGLISNTLLFQLRKFNRFIQSGQKKIHSFIQLTIRLSLTTII